MSARPNEPIRAEPNSPHTRSPPEMLSRPKSSHSQQLSEATAKRTNTALPNVLNLLSTEKATWIPSGGKRVRAVARRRSARSLPCC
eukprot:1422839-Pyramimonas_sp.AAC.2